MAHPHSGVTDQPGNLVDDHVELLGNLVLANGGDQVTLLRCNGGPTISRRTPRSSVWY